MPDFCDKLTFTSEEQNHATDENNGQITCIKNILLQDTLILNARHAFKI